MAQKALLLELLNEAAVMLEVLEPESFRYRAYYTALRALESSPLDLKILVEEKAAMEIKGIGKSLFAQIDAFYHTATLPVLEEVRQRWPDGLSGVLKVPGIGPKKVGQLYHQLGISSLAELEYACNENRLITLKGFGQKTQHKVMESITYLKSQQGKRLYAEVEPLAHELLKRIQEKESAQRAALVGEFRRQLPVLGGLCYLIQGEGFSPESLGGMEWESRESGEAYYQREYVGHLEGFAIKLYLADSDWWGTAMVQLTGSPEYLAEIEASADTAYPSEEAYFGALGVSLLPPALREAGQSDLKAPANELRQQDIAGLLHVHSTYSDGSASIRELALATRDLGYSYLGIADHSQTAVYAHGLTVDRLKEQWREIDQLNDSKELGDFRILKGIETDILADGSLDYDDEVLAQLDFCVASIHSQFRMGTEQMTERIIRAIENPYVSVIGHLTGRILLGRAGYKVDFSAIVEACAKHGTALELNASPYRLDVDWEMCRQAAAAGVKIAINPDAHHVETLQDVKYGVLLAQKAGLSRAEMYVLEGKHKSENMNHKS